MRNELGAANEWWRDNLDFDNRIKQLKEKEK